MRSNGKEIHCLNHVEEGEGKTKVSVLLTKPLIQLHSLYPKLILQIKHILDSYSEKFYKELYFAELNESTQKSSVAECFQVLEQSWKSK